MPRYYKFINGFMPNFYDLDNAIETQDMIEMTYRPYLSSDKSCPQMNPPITLVITDIQVDVLKSEYGHDVPQVITNPDNLRDVLHAFKHDLAFQAFYEVPEPQYGGVVLMRQAKNPVHAGIWLDVDGGGVLHCVREIGVVFQDIASLNLCGWFLHSYYRVKENT